MKLEWTTSADDLPSDKRARGGEWSFLIERDAYAKNVRWILRGWRNGEARSSVNEAGLTLREAKAIAASKVEAAAATLARGLNPDKPCGCSSNYECSLCEMKGGQS